MTPTPVEVPTLEGFYPLSQEFLRDPEPIFERARRECPIFFYAPLNFWAVTRYEDLVAGAAQWDKLSQRAAALIPVPEDLRQRITADFFNEHFMSSDPPEHTVARKSVNRAFTRGRVASLEPTIRQIAHDLIDGFVADGRCDLMEQFCYRLSLQTIARMLGLPETEEHLEQYRRWAETLLVLVSPRAAESDSEYTGPVKELPADELHRRWSEMADAREFFGEMVRAREADPQEDMITALVQVADGEGRPAMTHSRIVSHMVDLITAGTDTTANLMAQLVLLFDRHPEELAAVQAEPALWENAVEEVLRRRPTTIGMFRYATEDVEFSGVTIPAGSLVWLAYFSGGHDEAVFEAPCRFDVHRTNAKDHLAFGRGRHFCLGAPLARLETRVALQVLYERLPDLRIDPGQTLHYHEALVVFMLERLDASWSP